MKKSLQLLVIILLTAAVVPEAFAYNFVSGGIYYDITGSSPNTVAVTYATGSYNSYSGSVDIPNTVTYNGTTYTVTAIGNNAFRKCSNLTGVSIPYTVTSIGEYAFYQCGNLHSVNLSDKLTTIGTHAFDRSGLFSVTIPESVTSIGANAFERCNSLTSAVFNATNCTTATNMFYYCNYLTSLTIGNTVQTIPSNAFAYCNAITFVDIPSNVSTIGTNPFHHCTSLDSIVVSPGNSVYNHYFCNAIIHEDSHTLVTGCKNSTILNNVKKIGDFAFAGCTGLTGPLTISNHITVIGASAYSDCTGLTGPLTISNQVTVIGASAYSGCSGLTSLVIGTKVDSIGNSAFSNCIAISSVSFNADSCRYMGAYSATVFSGCNGLSTLLIGSNVKAVPAQAFCGCNHITGLLTIPNSVQNIGVNAFYGCNGFTSLVIGNHVQSIGNSTFYNCSNMGGTLTIPQAVISIGSSAFSGCTGFTSIAFDADSCTTGSLSGCSNVTSLSIGDNVKVIPANAFSGLSHISGALTIPNSVQNIGASAFSGCNGFTSLSMGNHVKSIGGSAFYNCSNMGGTLTIPQTVISIGSSAFSGCTGFTSIAFDADSCTTGSLSGCSNVTSLSIGNNVKVIPANAFSGLSHISGALTIPNSVQNIGVNAFYGCNGFTSLVIGNHVQSIGNSAFYNCSNMGGTLTIPQAVISIGSSAFFGCTGFTSIAFDADSCTTGSLSGCSNVTSLSIGNNVKVIPANAFSGLSYISGALTIPNSVKTIGYYAFKNCSGLHSLVIGNAVSAINSTSFEGCDGLTSLTIGKNVRTIYDGAFQNFTNLATVNFNADSCISMGSNSYPVFSGCDHSATLNIGDNVKLIPNYAFSNFTGLTGALTIPDSVETIGNYAFKNCSGLHSLVIGNAVSAINSTSFEGCDGLTSLTIGKNVRTIYDGAFQNFTNLATVNFNADRCTYMGLSQSPVFSGCNHPAILNIGDNVKFIPNNAFTNFTGLTGTLTIPDSVVTIGNYAFNNCSGLDSLIIGKSIENIGSSAFDGCSGLSFVNFNADSCVSMGSYNGYAFANCTNPATLIIGNNVKAIPDFAFENFSGIDTLVIGNSVSFIGHNSFSNCSGLTLISFNADSCTNVDNGNYNPSVFDGCDHPATLTIGNNVKCIPSNLFRGCSGLIGTLTIPNSVQNIGAGAFSGCTGFTSIAFDADSCTIGSLSGCSNVTSLSIGNNVKVIPANAFSGLSHISGSLTIPDSVKDIGNYAFYNCSGLTGELYMPNVDTIKVGTFANCSGFNTLIFGEGTRCIDHSAFYSCSGLTGLLNIPDNITSIGASAFCNCSGLDSLIIGKSIAIIGGYAFENCDRLSSVVFNSDSCIEMGGYDLVFEGCTNITSLDIGNNVKVIPSCSFCNLSALTGTIVIPDSVRTISSSSFKGCSGIDTLVIGKNVQFIGEDAFQNCTGLSSVVFNPDNCITMGYWLSNYNNHTVFNGCADIASLTIGDNVKNIPSYAFCGCNHITGLLTIPDSVRIIGNGAFQGCSGFSSMSIGRSVDSIGHSAFYGCTGLASITSYNETPPVLDLSSTHPFNAVSRNTPVYVPCGSAQDYRSEWKYSTNNTSSYFNNIYETLLPYSFSFSSEDTLKGTVQITTMPSCTESAIIEATPKIFYNFDHWSDGNTDNPRTLTLTQDTALVAYFREYTIMVASNDTTAGVVYMTGLPTSENPLATVEAVLMDSCYVFAGWSDGSTDNPHTISVTQDTLLSATFNSVVNLQITAPTTVCRGDSSTLIATGADRYLWFNGNTSSTIKILPDNSMVVTVTGTDNNGCSTSKGHHINVQSNPTLTFSGYTDICEGDSTIITAISSISINNILFENFADGVPSDWTIANNYLHTESLSGNHDKALVFPAYNLGHGFSDELIIPVQNLSIIQEPTLQFDVANSESVFYSGHESLSVFYSMDEGVTWNELYNKYGYSLATVSENTNQNFIPSDTQWRTETIDLTGVSGNVIIKFVFESDFYNYDHNNVWLDNIVLKPKINTQNVLLYEDFENPLSEEWGNIDTYGNGDAWLSSTHYSNDGIPAANRGEKCIVSVNQQNQCEHQLLTPTITIPTSGATLSYYINGYISSYAECIVYVVSNTQTEPLYFNFLMNSGWGKASVDLSAWAGEDIQIMFVHKWDYIVMLDDIMVLANDNYIWSDGSMSSQHSFSSSGTWQVTASDINGCHTTDSVTIAVWQPDTVEITINTPESFYVLNGEAFCQSGDYTQTLQNSNGCDSVVNLHLAIAPQDTVVINDTICGGYRDVLVKAPAWYLEEYYGITNPNLSDTVKVSFLYYYDENYNNIPIEIDQNYWDTHDYYLLPQVNAYTNTYGCDSIVVYNKYMTFSDWTMIWDTVCGSYNWNGTVLTNSGEYYEIETYTNARGCASSVNLTLTIFSSTYEELSANACESYTLNDITYTESGVYTQYTDTLLPIQREAYYNQWENYWYYFDNYGNFHYSESETYIDTILGCKVITLNLTINHATFSDTIATACDSFEWHGATYTQSGDYPITLTNATGCDSIVTLHLTINYSTANDFSDTACDSYTWNDSVYTLSGNYTQTFTAANSCDSVVTLHLTINNSDQTELTAVACGEYVWLDSTYTTSGNYSKIYTNMAGCDSIVTLHLTINPIPEVSITGNTTICPDGGTMLTATGADSYLWSNWSTGTSIPVNVFGVYSVTGTTAAGCTNTASVTVLVAQPPVITITGDLEICAGDTGAITAHGGSTYMWSNGSTDSSITVSSIGSWQVIGYDENGCNSMASATVTVWQPASSQFSVTVNDSCYIWNTISYCESGTYTQTLQTVHGCDSVVTLHLTLTTTVYADVYETACNNYTWNNVTYNQSGDYTQTFSMANGSDSVVTLHLTLNPTYAVNDARTICASELPFIWNGVQFIEAGTQSVTLQTINDCDSVVTMTLMVNQSATGIDVQEACDSFEWIDGVTYTTSTDIPTYTIESGAANGCDSIVTLHLTINTPTAGDTTATVCESFDWYEYSNLTQSGDYTHTLTNAAGCDSTVTLHLTVNQPVTTTSSATICDSELPYVWNGLTFNEAGTQSLTLQTMNGCDSVVTMTLTVNHSATGIDEQEACDSFEWIDGVTYTTSTDIPTYTIESGAANGCDSIVTLHLTINQSATSEFTIVTNESCYVWNGIEYCETGDYVQNLQTQDGCDSVVTLHLTIGTGINNHDLNASLKVYPNPTSNIVNVELSTNNGQSGDVVIQVFDVYGKLLDVVNVGNTDAMNRAPTGRSMDSYGVANTHDLSSQSTQIDLSSYANGVYFIKAVSDGNVLAVRKVVKNR